LCFNILTIGQYNKGDDNLPLKKYERDKILKICFEEFVENGYTNSSTSSLAKAAGISKALIFHHFGSKKNLYIEILEKHFDEMASEFANETHVDYDNYFEARESKSLDKLEYLKKHPKTNKILYEAFYATPEELKKEIPELHKKIEKKYASHTKSANENIWKLFNEINFREGVDPGEAFELINIVTEHFRISLASEIVDETIMSDEAYWENFIAKKRRFMDMMRYGIEKKKEEK